MTSRLVNSLEIVLLLIMLVGCDRQEPAPITTNPSAFISPIQPTMEVMVTNQKTATVVNAIQVNTSPDPDPPLALAFLEDQTIHFECLNRQNCIPEVDLEGHVHFDSLYYLGKIFYWNPENIYITLLSSSAIPDKMDIIHVNSITGEIKTIQSPDEAESSLIKIAGGRLILARFLGQRITILEGDLSITEVGVGFDIHKMIIDGDKVIILNQIPVEMDGRIYVDVSVVNVISKEVKSERLKLPGLDMPHNSSTPETNRKYLIYIEGISGDLNNLYCVFRNGNEPDIARLGTFNIETSMLVAMTSGGATAGGYGQYHEILYTEYSEKDDGGSGASLYNMATGRSLIDLDNNRDWIRNNLLVVPFGDNILLGRSNEIVLLSPTGIIIKRYALPEIWADQDYQIVRFEK